MGEIIDGKLCVKRSEAAKLLGIDKQTLWKYSYPRGPIPCLYLAKNGGRAFMLYPLDDLKAWIQKEKERYAPKQRDVVVTGFSGGICSDQAVHKGR